MKHPFFSAIVCVLAGISVATAAEMNHSRMHMHKGTASSPAAAAFEDASMKMHRAMAIEYSGNADADFVRSMIPHHQGAIDMAKIELRYGRDPELRKLAEGIIKAQEAEIAEMRAWMKTHQR